MGYKKHKQYRLPGYDYSSNGNYFITICTKNREEFLGKIINGKMNLSLIGKITESIWKQIPEKFQNIFLDVFQVMPDHFHAITKIKNPYNCNMQLINHIDRGHLINHNQGNCRHLINQMPTDKIQPDKIKRDKISINNDNQIFKSGIKNNPMELKNITLGKIIRWFKGRVKFEASKINQRYHWQTRFHEKIIRNKKEYYAIKNYIINNPGKTIKKKRT